MCGIQEILGRIIISEGKKIMKVKFSVLVPLYNTPESFLREMIESVQNQTYKEWELCLADASDEKHKEVGKIVSGYLNRDKRIHYKKLEKNGGISENTNACIEMSTGNYFALLDHDDVLDVKALEEVNKAIQKQHADFIYSDEAKFTDSIENWFAPNYKPDFSKYELRAHNYICHLTVYSRELLNKVGRYRSECDGSQDHDMVLRLTEKASKITHVAKVLYFWRVHSGSVSAGVENKSYAIDAAKKAVEEQLIRCGETGEIVTHTPWSLIYHPLYKINGTPLVGIVLYGAENSYILKQCIQSIDHNAGYPNYQYLILAEDDCKEYQNVLEKMLLDHPYNILAKKWEKDIDQINEYLKTYKVDYFLFLNANSKIESNEFILEMLRLAQRKDIWAVGSKVYSSNNTIREAGIAIAKAAPNGVVYRFQNEISESHGYEAALRHIRNVSAVSEKCLMVEKTKYIELDGFSKKWSWYRGIDACLRAIEKKYLIVWTPYAEITELDPFIMPDKEEVNQFFKVWKAVLDKEDPYYNRFLRYDLDHLPDKNTLGMLVKKSTEYLAEEGIKGLVNRIQVYRGGIGKRSSSHLSYTPVSIRRHVYRDVLFINGCAPMVPHPPRYRVTHQREQLEACGITTDCVYYEELDPDIVTDFRCFIFFRCPYTNKVGELIKRAKSMNRLVLFDIDDLVVDTKYTDTIPYVMSLDEAGKKVYDDGVIRMGKTLKLCDAAITTTERLAEELSNYVSEVLINRNTASERMYELSEKAVYERDILPFLDEKELPSYVSQMQYFRAKEKAQLRGEEKIHIGYFSGSITHNEDFDMIKSALIRILREFPSANLHLVGELDLPLDLQCFKNQIILEPFTDWERLPELIASVDINLAPITKSIFNEAKSENKWTEAALVKVPTVASNLGAFAVAIHQNETGILCDNVDDWYQALKLLITNKKERIRLAENAYHYVIDNYITIYTGKKLADYILKKMHKNIAFVLPSSEISGGIMVAMKHAVMLKKRGMDVFILCDNERVKPMKIDNETFYPLSTKHTSFFGKIDNCVATMWSTVPFVRYYHNAERRFYLVQNYETDFYKPGNILRGNAEQTYHQNINYLTISKWCEKWLMNKYGHEVGYMPNGINAEMFYPVKRKFDGKIRILIEGDCSVDYKNVDESFKIVEKLDKSKFEVWYLSYQGRPKEWYRVDRCFNKVPYEDVADIYRQCHILVKSSLLESFSYPPLEMMATGGYVVVAPNEGNMEYLRHGENCLMYAAGDINAAIKAIERILTKKDLRETLYEGGQKTVLDRSWEKIEEIIVNTYNLSSTSSNSEGRNN